MSEIRHTVLVDNSVLLATERGLRPNDFLPGKETEPSNCPFCPGNENLTPKPERFRIDGQPNQWELRVVPNMFPAARIESKTRFMIDSELAQTVADAHGAHEIIIETPHHEQDFSEFSLQQFINLFTAIVAQTKDLYGDEQIRFLQVFKNYGQNAGATLKHPHTQLIGLPQIPEKIKDRLHRLENYEATHGYSVFQVVVERAEKDSRKVIKTKNFICLAPYEAKFPFEVWILPLKDKSQFKDSYQDFRELAEVTSETFRRLKAAFGFLPDFNIIFDEAPPHLYENSDRFYRWRLRIYPRMTRIAGFELATGFFINPTSPEESAAYLQNVKI